MTWIRTNYRKLMVGFVAFDVLALTALAFLLLVENATGLRLWLAYAWAGLWTWRTLGRFLSVALVAVVLFFLGLPVYDALFQRKARADRHAVKMEHMRTQAAHARTRQLAAPDLRGGWTATVDPARPGWLDLEQLDTEQDRLLAALAQARGGSRGPRGPAGPLLEADNAPTLPTLVRPEELLGEVITYRDMPLGIGPEGVVRGDLVKFVHWAIAGSSGWGKSALMRWLAYLLAMSVDPIDLVLIDLEDVTLAPFETARNAKYPVARDERTILAVLRALLGEVERRSELFEVYRDRGVDSLARYNAVSEDRLAPVAVLIDEAAALMQNADVRDAIMPALWRSRKYGIFYLCAAQVWYANTIDSRAATQFGTATHFHAEKASQGRALGMPEAADINVQGRAILRMPGRANMMIQTPLITERHMRQVRGDGPMELEYPTLMACTPAEAKRLSGHDPEAEYLANLLASPLAGQVQAAMADGAANPSQVCKALGKSAGGKPYTDISRLYKHFATSTSTEGVAQ